MPRSLSSRELQRPRSSRRSSRESILTADELEVAAGTLLSLQRGLTGGRDLAGSRYMEKKALLGAYLLYYWPVSYMQISLLLEELRPFLPNVPGRILDVGCGPGPAAAALIDFGARDLVLVDASSRALDLAEDLLIADSGNRAGPSPSISFHNRDIQSADSLPAGPYEFIVVAHALNEIWKDEPDRLERRRVLLERIAALLSPEGLLLVVEPAALAPGRETLALRDGLAAAGYGILAPCPGSYPCPALAAGPTRTCHLDTPWSPPEPVASLASAAGLDRQSVKCTWFALRAKVPGIRDMAGSGHESSGAPDPRAPSSGGKTRPDHIIEARVVSDALLNKAGRLRFFLCADGRLTSVSAAREDSHARAMGFFDLRRGDVVTLSLAELRNGGGLGIVSDTILSLDRRAPLPDRTATAGSPWRD